MRVHKFSSQGVVEWERDFTSEGSIVANAIDADAAGQGAAEGKELHGAFIDRNAAGGHFPPDGDTLQPIPAAAGTGCDRRVGRCTAVRLKNSLESQAVTTR